jgi:glycerophosphoryl diester phosphodiesterase/HEAT repeat protein
MKRIGLVFFLIFSAAGSIRAATPQAGGVQLLCHRTANEDVPENTLESLQEAALLGCNAVEVDIRKTLDGELVLNHDGLLERLSDGVGEIEKSYYGDLQLLDAGAWMGERFAGMRIARFDEVLRYARKHDLRLSLDIKTKGILAEIFSIVQREGMLQRVQFGGDWGNVKRLYPRAITGDRIMVWVQPGVSAEQVKAYHREGKPVVVNFSANDYAMNLTAMKAAVAAGADAISVDYPRLGADAVGRPVERRLNALAIQANSGDREARSKAILALAKYQGFDLQGEFVHWLLDADEEVSRAAAVALVEARPRTAPADFAQALRSEHADVRANAAWALGAMKAPAEMLLPLLRDNDPHVLQSALIALVRMPGTVSPDALLPLLASQDLTVKGAAARALARHQPEVAATAIRPELEQVTKSLTIMWAEYVRHGKPVLTDADVQPIKMAYRCQLQLLQAISIVNGPEAAAVLEQHAFRPGKDFSIDSMNMSAFELWDRIGADPMPAIRQLSSEDVQVADRAEWMLVQGGPRVLPDVRKALADENAQARKRAIEIVAWQGDVASLRTMREMEKTDKANAALIAWAIDKIQTLHPAM